MLFKITQKIPDFVVNPILLRNPGFFQIIRGSCAAIGGLGVENIHTGFESRNDLRSDVSLPQTNPNTDVPKVKR